MHINFIDPVPLRVQQRWKHWGYITALLMTIILALLAWLSIPQWRIYKSTEHTLIQLRKHQNEVRSREQELRELQEQYQLQAKNSVQGMPSQTIITLLRTLMSSNPSCRLESLRLESNHIECHVRAQDLKDGMAYRLSLERSGLFAQVTTDSVRREGGHLTLTFKAPLKIQ